MSQPPFDPAQGPPAYGPPPGQPAYGPPPAGPPPYGYGPPAYGPPQPPTPPAKKPLYKRAWFLVVAGVLALTVVVQAANGGAGEGNDSSSTGVPVADVPAATGAVPSDEEAPVVEEAAPVPALPGLGVPVADGDFSFVVNAIDCSLTEVGSEYLSTEAQGVFCIVDLAVSNIGDAPQSFLGDNAKLFNAEGQEYSADGAAAIYLEDSASLYEEINPGNTLASKVVFDVPVGMVPTMIELHDSAFSGGVQVALQPV